MLENPLANLRQLKGCPLSIVVALSLVNQPVAAKWLSSITGYSPHSITSALVFLEELQLVSSDTRRSNWRLTNGVRQLPLSMNSLDNVSDRENRDPEATTTALSLNSKKNLQKAEAAAFNVSDRENRDPDRENRDPILRDELLNLLRDAGIGEPTASNLCKMDHITFEYADAHISQANKNNDPVALLIHRMRSNDPQPPKYIEPGSDEDRMRYVTGKFADYIDN